MTWHIILRLRVVTTCWSWAWTNRTSPSSGVGLGSPLAACSVYRDLTCSVHITVNNLCLFSCQWHVYFCNWGPYVRLAYLPNMLSSWNKVIIIAPLWKSGGYTGFALSFRHSVTLWFCHSVTLQMKIFVTLFSGTVRPRRLKLGTHVDSGQMYRVYRNQAAPAYSSLYFFIFLSLQFSNIEIFRHTFLRNCEA